MTANVSMLSANAPPKTNISDFPGKVALLGNTQNRELLSLFYLIVGGSNVLLLALTYSENKLR